MPTKLIAYCACDPGAKGYYCLLVPRTKEVTFLSNLTHSSEILKWFNNVTNKYNLAIVMIEDVHSIFGSGAKANFTFGKNLGKVITIPESLSLSIDLVQPKKWQKFIGVTVKGSHIKKEVASICVRLFPHVSIVGIRGGLQDGKSDSLMIAHYASQTFKI